MLCPQCGQKIPDGALVCPSCGFDLDLTQKISVDKITLDKSTWCPTCGALVPKGTEVCPTCGSRLTAVRRERKIDLPTIEREQPVEEPKEETPRSQAHIESAIPDPEDFEHSVSARQDKLPRVRTFIFAAVFAVLAIWGLVYLVMNPIEFSSDDEDETVEIEESSTEVIEYLTGQDLDSSTEDESDSDSSSTEEEDTELTLEESIVAAWESLGELAEELEANVELLNTDGISGDADARAAGQEEAYYIAVDISNLISEIDSMDDGDGTWTETLANLDTLGNWLRNRADALMDAWELSCASEDPSADADAILAELSSSDYYLELFEEYYDEWAPETSSSETSE